MLIWFNGQCLMREGLRICGVAKPFPPNSYVIISRMDHYTYTLYTVHESCFDAICIVRILTVVPSALLCSFGATLAALMIMG